MKEVLDVAAMSRSLKDAEQAQNLAYVEFGQAGLSIFAHPDVGVASLTDEQISDIFTGKVTSWSGVGGPDLPIVVFHRAEDTTSTESLRTGLLGDAPLREDSQMVDRSSELSAVVSGTPGGVSYALWPAVTMDGVRVQSIALDGVAPTESGYSMVQPLSLGYLRSHEAEIQPLIAWLRSKQGQAELRKLGIITPDA